MWNILKNLFFASSDLRIFIAMVETNCGSTLNTSNFYAFDKNWKQSVFRMALQGNAFCILIDLTDINNNNLIWWMLKRRTSVAR